MIKFDNLHNLDSIKIVIAGTGYVGLSLAVLLSQKHEVVAVDVVSEKVEMINQRRECRQMTQSQRYIQHICTAAVYEVVFFAYRVAIPRQGVVNSFV